MKKKKHIKENKTIKTKNDLIKELPQLKQKYPWLKEIDSTPLSTAIFDLEDAFKKFYKTKSYPKYKSKHKKNTYRTNYIKNTYKNKIYENIKIDMENKIITMPKLNQIKIR